MRARVASDRLAFLEGFTTNFFAAADKTDLISEDQRLYAKAIAAGASPKGTLDCVAAFGRTDFRDDIAKIQILTLVIHGDSDGVVPFDVSGKRSAELIAGAELMVIEGGPHAINATHVAQFNAASLAFLAK